MTAQRDWTEEELAKLRSSPFHLGVLLKCLLDQLQMDRLDAMVHPCIQEQAA